MMWRDQKDFDRLRDTAPESAGRDVFDKCPAGKRSGRVSCAENASRIVRVSAVAPGQRQRVRRSVLGQRANAVPPVIEPIEYPARATRSCTIMNRARKYITSGLPQFQTFRKMRWRQSNHSRIQQNITAPKEYSKDAFGGLAPSDTSLAWAASCQLSVAPSGYFTVKV